MTGRFPPRNYGSAFDINSLERGLRDMLLNSRRVGGSYSSDSPQGEVQVSALSGHQDLEESPFPRNGSQWRYPSSSPGFKTNQMFDESCDHFGTNPAGVIGWISLAAYHSAAFQPMRPVPKNYNFDTVTPTMESKRFGTAFEKYWGVTSDLAETVYMSNRSTHDVIAIDPSYGVAPIVKISQPTSAAMEKPLFRPTGLEFDKQGNRLIIADKDNHRIAIFSKDGKFVSKFGESGFGNGQFSYPWDVAVSPDGNRIAVTDSRNHRVQVFDKFGNFLNKFSMIESHPYNFREFFDYPRGITFDLTGRSIFVTDFNTHSIFEIDADTMAYRKMNLKYHSTEELLRPQGIVVDNQGDLVVCDTKNNVIRVFNLSGSEVCRVKKIGSRDFDTPTDLTFLSNQNLLVMDVDGRAGVF